MNMRILHTSDWHLGHTLHEHTREQEHRTFLAWLLETIVSEQVDALIICGDIFDSANPSAQSQKMWYGFLAAAHQRLPELDIVVIGGNHDSAARLDAPTPLLESLRVHVTGGLPYLDGGDIDWRQLIVPLHDKAGVVSAWLASVPFLRQADLPPIADDSEDALIDGVRKRYAEAVDALRAQGTDGQALIVTGHCYLSGALLSEMSERKILGGNQHALPDDIFPDDISYVALGHLHLAQAVGGREQVRYSGSPLPLSVSEIHYSHQVCIADLENGLCMTIRQIPIPRAVEFMRIPSVGALHVEDLLHRLSELPEAGVDTDRNVWPYLEVSPLLDKPRPGLREEILQALNDKAVRLVRIASTAATVDTPHIATEGVSLDDITPEEVFVRCYRSRFPDEPSPDYMSAFSELLQHVEQGEVQP
jgi:DNA repair protein SbcD/Mre11